MWQKWTSGSFGLWFLVSAFIFAGSKTGDLTNDLICGIVLVVLGLWAAARRKIWQNWLIGLVGVWMIVAGFWFPSSYGGNVANNLIAGLIVAIAGFWPSHSSSAMEVHI